MPVHLESMETENMLEYQEPSDLKDLKLKVFLRLDLLVDITFENTYVLQINMHVSLYLIELILYKLVPIENLLIRS